MFFKHFSYANSVDKNVRQNICTFHAQLRYEYQSQNKGMPIYVWARGERYAQPTDTFQSMVEQ